MQLALQGKLHSPWSLTFVSFIGDLSQVNEVGPNGNVVDFVTVTDLDLHPLAEWGEHLCEDNLLIPLGLIAAFLDRGFPLGPKKETNRRERIH